MGEHTDYNGGAVLPTIVPQRTTVAMAARSDRQLVVRTTLHDAEARFTVGDEAPGRGWLDYVQGCVWALAEARFAVPGADVAIASTLPPGAGLSSSAALEVACLRA